MCMCVCVCENRVVRTVFSLSRVSPIFFLSSSLTHLLPFDISRRSFICLTSSARVLDRGPLYLNFSLISLDWHESRGNIRSRINDDVRIDFFFFLPLFLLQWLRSSRVRFDKNCDCEHSCRYRYLVAAVLARLSANRFLIFRI